MNAISMVSHRPFQRIQPLSLLAQSISRQVSGRLEISSGATSWLIYLHQGKLSFATNSVDPFERLDRHLRLLNRQIPTLVSAVRVQVKMLFGGVSGHHGLNSPDYQAIRWLVEQRYLDLPQAATLIEEIAKEVISSFLDVTEGMYEVLDKQSFEDYPNLCQLELRPIVEHSQNQSRRSQMTNSTATKVQNLNLVHEEPSKLTAPKAKTGMDQRTIDRNPKPAPEGYAPAQRVNAPTSVTKTHYTVVCIDDSPTVLQVIDSFLDDSSFSVVMINDPVKALMQVIRTKPDIILLDVGMPNLDGYELCSLLRKNSSFKSIPIIMVTGQTGFIDRAKARFVGASGYLTKPFTQSELLKMMFKYLA